MNREEAIRSFVKENYEFLTKKDIFEKATYRSYLRNYFEKKLKFKFGVPKDKEICDALVETIIKQRNISKHEELEEIVSGTPLLKLNNVKAEDYKSSIDSISKTFILKEELEKVTGIERIEKLTEHVKKERAKEIEELILQKKEEYRKLPSILDDTDFVEPEELPQKDETKEWWEELNLRENPFPGPLDGFFLVDNSIYDEITVETPPIQWALSKIQKDPIDLFHKGFLLGGDFGTGKTTFFDFMAPHLTMKHIEPIRIALSDSINVANYLQKFERELCLAVAKITKSYSIPTTTRIIDFEEARLLMLDIQQKGAHGFFIFLDDLHKNIDRNSVFNFLANLQITKNTLSRDGINVVFFVAGFPDWRARIRQDSALTGFFDAADELTLPEVTPEVAAQAIRKRLQAFSVNPEKEIVIKEEFLRTVFKKVSAEIGSLSIGFRPYIQEALNNFAAKRFDILSIDYTKLDDKIMAQIKTTLESNSKFKESIDKLVFGSKIQKREIREMTLKILCEVYLRRGITEEEEIFSKNRFSFKRLAECGLVQKYNRKGKLVWFITPELQELNKRIITDFKLSMEDYLVPTYSIPARRVKEEKGIQNRTEVYEADLEEWKKDLEVHITESLADSLRRYIENIYPYTKANSKRSFPAGPDELEKITECIWSMMKSIIRFESPLLLDIYGETDILGWTLRYRSLESSQHFITQARNLGKGIIQKTDMARLISFADDSFNELWSEFKKSVRIYRTSLVRCFEIPKNVLKIIYSEHDQIFSFTRPKDEYFQVLDRFVRLMEETLRKYLLVSCSLVFGPYHARIRCYPEDIKKYITGSYIVSVSYEGYNEFENLNRGQYRFLFTQVSRTNEFYRYIVEPIVRNWDMQDITSFFQLFGNLNVISAHSKTQYIDERKKDIPTFFRLSCRMISSLTARLRDLLTQNNSILSSDGGLYLIFGYRGGKDDEKKVVSKSGGIVDLPSGFYRHDIMDVVGPTSINKIMEKPDNVLNDVELDILDIEGTRIKFGMEYCQTMSLIAYLLANYKIRAITLYGTNICLRKI